MALLEFSLEVGTNKTRIINGLAYGNGYQDEIDGEANPETKAQFVKRMVIKWIKQSVKSYEAKEAQRIARETALADADTISVE